MRDILDRDGRNTYVRFALRNYWRDKFLPLPMMLLPIASLLLLPTALAQNNLGELLDAGAKALSTEEFKRELVQRTILGPTQSGGSVEVMYAANGSIHGTGVYAKSVVASSPISGAWTIDESGRVCTIMQIGGGPGGPVMGMTLPSRCQFWFRYDQNYFLSDSDSDRDAKVLKRTVKQ